MTVWGAVPNSLVTLNFSRVAINLYIWMYSYPKSVTLNKANMEGISGDILSRASENDPLDPPSSVSVMMNESILLHLNVKT